MDLISQKNQSTTSYFDNLYNHLIQPIAIINNGLIYYSNHAFKEIIILQSKPNQLLSVDELFHPQNLKVFNQFVFSNLHKSTVETDLKIIDSKTNQQIQCTGYVSCVKFTYELENFIQLSIVLEKQEELEKLSIKTYQKSKENLHIKTIFDSLQSVSIFSLDTDFKLLSYNKTFLNVLKQYFNKFPSIGDSFIEYLWPFVRNGNYHNLLNPFRAAAEGEFISMSDVLKTKDNDELWINFTLNPIDFGKGVEEITCTAIDITKQKQNEEKLEANLVEKEILIKEIHHRVKNNLQIISSLLNLQNNYVTDAVTDAVLTECQNRVKAISFVHESLYINNDFNNLKIINYVQGLVSNLRSSFASSISNIDICYDIDESFINLDYAVPLGLIINELVTNSFKYAFTEEKSYEIFLQIYQKNQKLVMVYKDNGVGFDKSVDLENLSSLGIQLIQILTEQLEGNLTIENSNGVKYLFNFEYN